MSLREKKKRIDSHTHSHRDPYTWNRELTLPENVGECERELEAFSVREREAYKVYEWERETEQREWEKARIIYA